MRVVTWNVNFRSAECLDGLRGLEPDILLLQEVKHGTAASITDRLHADGLRHVTYSGVPTDERKRYGNVIASRWPLAPAPRGWAPKMRWPQLAQRVSVQVEGSELDVINVHVPNGSGNGWDKVYALEAVADALASSRDVPRILAGDFNEPQTILSNGTVVSWGQLIDTVGSVHLGRRSSGGAGPGRFKDGEGRTHDLSRWHAAVTRFFDSDGDLRLRHVRVALGLPPTPLPVTHVTRGKDRFFDHVFVSKHLVVRDLRYVDSVCEGSRYSDHSAVCVNLDGAEQAEAG